MAARGNTIVLSADPKGRFVEGIIGAGLTPSPGTILQIQPATAMVGGRHTFELYNADVSGGRPKGPHYVLREDYLQGKTIDDAYAAGDRCFLYVPVAGDELNLLLDDADTGTTTNDVAAGTVLIVEDASGKLIATTGSPEAEVAMLLTALSDLDGDELGFCVWTGH